MTGISETPDAFTEEVAESVRQELADVTAEQIKALRELHKRFEDEDDRCLIDMLRVLLRTHAKAVLAQLGLKELEDDPDAIAFVMVSCLQDPPSNGPKA